MATDQGGLHSAVLGMLSLSQGGAEFAGNGWPGVGGGGGGGYYDAQMAAAYRQQIGAVAAQPPPPTSDGGRKPNAGHSRDMPPTPPGSPDDRKLLIVDSPQKPACADQQLQARLLQQPKAEIQQPVGTQAAYFDNYSLAAFNNPLAAAGGFGGASSADLAFMQQQTHQMSLGQPAALLNNPLLAGALQSSSVRPASTGGYRRNNRGEKRAVPDEQKDGKYFERRAKNNEAAKKSRDSRKNREDEIAMKAATLERSNAALRATVNALRDEAAGLRAIIHEKNQQQLMQQLGQPQQQQQMDKRLMYQAMG